MKLNDYQKWTKTTAIYPKSQALEYLGLGITSEAGEVAGKIKKFIRDKTFDEKELAKEIGDCFWYLARLCDELQIDAETVLEQNYIKLMSRQARNTIVGSGDDR